MNVLPLIYLLVIILYLAAMVLAGFFFSRKNKNPDQYSKASGSIPGWAVGVSLYATFLSSNTFIGVPGKAFGGNWRSEEHTSELQSLMRISYAVFCLKKKN